MVTIKKPKSVTITVRDRRENKSKSFTVYNTSLGEVCKMIKERIIEE